MSDKIEEAIKFFAGEKGQPYFCGECGTGDQGKTLALKVMSLRASLLASEEKLAEKEAEIALLKKNACPGCEENCRRMAEELTARKAAERQVAALSDAVKKFLAVTIEGEPAYECGDGVAWNKKCSCPWHKTMRTLLDAVKSIYAERAKAKAADKTKEVSK